MSDILLTLAANAVTGKTVVTAALNVERTTAHLPAGVKDVPLKPYTPAESMALQVGRSLAGAAALGGQL